MYYFDVQFTGGDIYIVRVEHCGNMVCGIVDAEREARRIMAKYSGRRDFVIKVLSLEDVLSQIAFTENIARLN